jgi:hypothetical protein
MNARTAVLQDAENNLKQLMAGRNPGHGKGSGSRRENSLQDRDRRSSYGIHDFVTLGKISRQPLQKLARGVRYSHHSRRPA